jgi:hypothetical protein
MNHQCNHRWRVAVHEAAHALALRFQQVPVTGVTVDPDGRGGRTHYDQQGVADPRIHTFVACAGREAENNLLGPNPNGHVAHADDFNTAWRCATHYSHGDHNSGAHVLAECRRDAAEFVRQHALHIGRVARELYARGGLSGRQLTALVAAPRR